MTLRHHLTIGLLLVSLSACTPWTRVDQATRLETKGSDYSLSLPLGWVKNNNTSNDLFITRDGPALNYIVVNRQPHDSKLPKTKRETRANMLPHEMAELVLAEWKSNEATANLEVLANTPAFLGGKPVARVHIRYKNERGPHRAHPDRHGRTPKGVYSWFMKRRRSSISSATWLNSRPWWQACVFKLSRVRFAETASLRAAMPASWSWTF